VDGSGGMLIGIGHDLQLVHEIAGREGLATEGVFFTERECAHVRRAKSAAVSMAGLFSAKESLYKALPEVPPSSWTDIEIVHDQRGAPSFCFHGAVGALFEKRGWSARLAITHSGDYASSVVIITCETNATAAGPGKNERFLGI
jgi:holo-[acyl-carrier protein] synthase